MPNDHLGAITSAAELRRAFVLDCAQRSMDDFEIAVSDAARAIRIERANALLDECQESGGPHDHAAPADREGFGTFNRGLQLVKADRPRVSLVGVSDQELRELHRYVDRAWTKAADAGNGLAIGFLTLLHRALDQVQEFRQKHSCSTVSGCSCESRGR